MAKQFRPKQGTIDGTYFAPKNGHSGILVGIIG
jgi:hypothetical protein